MSASTQQNTSQTTSERTSKLHKRSQFLNDPHGLKATHATPYEMQHSGAAFDPQKHLQIELPEFVYDKQFNKVPYRAGRMIESFAASQPFQLLSEEGVKLLNEIVEQHKEHPLIAQNNARASLFLRGLGFVSPFVNGMAESPVISHVLSGLAGDALVSHPMIMHQGHVNYGRKTGKVVDAWHADSVDYVLVVMMSDPKDFQGGELQVVKQGNVEGAVQMIESGAMKPDDVLTVRFQKPGQAILMHGSKHIHRVMPVTGGEKPRLSCILSFVSRNVQAPDLTRYGTFKKDKFAHVEYARHKAWRAEGFLKQLKARPLAGTSVKDVVGDLEAAKRELERCIALLKDEADDEMPFYDETADKFIRRKQPVSKL